GIATRGAGGRAPDAEHPGRRAGQRQPAHGQPPGAVRLRADPRPRALRCAAYVGLPAWGRALVVTPRPARRPRGRRGAHDDTVRAPEGDRRFDLRPHLGPHLAFEEAGQPRVPERAPELPEAPRAVANSRESLLREMTGVGTGRHE